MTEIKTDSQIKKIVKENTGKKAHYSISGYQGLRLRVRGGSVDFQHRYSNPVTKKRKEMTLGKYPALSLEVARKAHADNLRLLIQGIDPIESRNSGIAKSAIAQQNTFGAVAKSWLDDKVSNPETAPSAKTLSNWNSYFNVLNKAFGNRPVADITPLDVLLLCKEIQVTHIHKGNRVKEMAQKIFAHAVINGLIDFNPVLQLTGTNALKINRRKHYPALTNPDEFAVLLKEIDGLDTKKIYDKSILQLLAFTFVRIGDLVQMKWADINFEEEQWVFEPQKCQRRADMVNHLVVPLAPQVLIILQEMKVLTGMFEYVFHSPRKYVDYYDAKNINKLLKNSKMNLQKLGGDAYMERQGYRNVHSPHGFRASAKTMLMERLKYSHLLTEMQSGRSMPDAYGNTYNRMEGIEERTKLMCDWADYIDNLKNKKCNLTK